MTQVVLFGDSGHLTTSRPLAIYTLASSLRSHGITCQTVWAWNFISDETFEEICNKFLSLETLVVGISTTLLNKNFIIEENFWGVTAQVAEQRFKLIRRLAPNAQIIAGGSQLAEIPVHRIPFIKYIDLFVTGEGESSLLSIVRAKQENQRVNTVQIGPSITSQDLYPYEDFSTTSVTRDQSDCILPGESLVSEFSRGCIFRCSFCSYPLKGKNKSDFNKSVDALVSELKHNYDQFGTTHYYIADDLLNDSETKVDRILAVSEQLPFRLSYTGFVRLDMIRRFPKMANKLKESGLIGCFMGIETIDAHSGQSVGKGLGLGRINEGLSMLQEYWNNKIIVESGFILGLPHDTPETKFELLEWLRQPLVRNTIRHPVVTSLNINSYRKLSEIDKDPAAFGYTISPETKNWSTPTYNQNHARTDAKWLSDQYYNDRKFNTPGNRVDVFTLPYLLSITDCREEIINLMLNDCSSMFENDQEWKTWTAQQCKQHRTRYIDKLLER